MSDIDMFYNELENELNDKTKDLLEKIRHKIDYDPEYRDIKKKEIKLIIYNNKDKVNKEVITSITDKNSKKEIEV
jgi:hypothetical protein